MNFLEPFEILKHLDKLNIVKETTSEYHCTCPVCGDGGFKIEKDTGLFNAFKCGCEIPKIREAIKPLAQAFEEILPPKSISPKQVRNHKYTDWLGNPKAVVKRVDDGEGNKEIKQGHWTGEGYQPGLPKEIREDIALYRWPEVKQAMQDGEAYIFFTEGEGKADALWELGLPATTSIGGSKGYDNYGTYKGAIRGSKVVVCPDMDSPGVEYAKRVQQDYPDCLWLHSFPSAPQWGNIAKGKGHDIANWIAAGATVEDILQAIEDKPRVYEPEIQSVEDQEAEQVKAEIRKYSEVKDPIKKLLAAKKLRKKLGVSPSELRDLEIFCKEETTVVLRPIGDILSDTFSEIERRSLGEDPLGIESGFKDLDAMTSGFQKSDLIIVAGRPSAGKTALCMSLANNAAEKHAVHFISLEQSANQLSYRMLSGKTSIPYGKLVRGRFNANEPDRLAKEIGEMTNWNLKISDAPGLTLDAIESAISRQSEQPELIIIDYLQLIEGPGENETARTSNISRGLKNLARKYNAPVIALSQLSRGVEQRQDKRPMMSDLRSSGAIEQDADLIILLYRDEYYNPNTPDRGIAELIVAKHRNGPTGTVKLLFEPEYTRFSGLNTMSWN